MIFKDLVRGGDQMSAEFGEILGSLRGAGQL
jgi:hypothetical protein